MWRKKIRISCWTPQILYVVVLLLLHTIAIIMTKISKSSRKGRGSTKPSIIDTWHSLTDIYIYIYKEIVVVLVVPFLVVVAKPFLVVLVVWQSKNKFGNVMEQVHTDGKFEDITKNVKKRVIFLKLYIYYYYYYYYYNGSSRTSGSPYS